MKYFCMFVKTYSNDLDRVIVLLNSVKKYNKDDIDVVVSVPELELDLFKRAFKNYSVALLTDESICSDLFAEKKTGLSLGYLNQQIVKLAYWEQRQYQFYLCLDSDCCFIRDFYLRDFFYDKNTPYSNLYEWETHFLDRDHRKWIGIYRRNQRLISSELGLDISRMITCSNCAIFSTEVLESFKTQFLQLKGYSYKDIIEICPFEFSWYSLWLIKTNQFRIVPVSHFFKVFHYRKQYSEARRKLVSKQHLAEMYVGIVLNSNWQPLQAPYYYQNPHFGHVFLYAIRRFLAKQMNSVGKRIRKRLSSKG